MSVGVFSQWIRFYPPTCVLAAAAPPSSAAAASVALLLSHKTEPQRPRLSPPRSLLLLPRLPSHLPPALTRCWLHPHPRVESPVWRDAPQPEERETNSDRKWISNCFEEDLTLCCFCLLRREHLIQLRLWNRSGIKLWSVLDQHVYLKPFWFEHWTDLYIFNDGTHLLTF